MRFDTVKIYQLKNIEETPYAFMGYNFATKHGLNFNDYDLVYGMTITDGSLDKIYEDFNINIPNDFRGHSLSVSDIVEFSGNKFYCDSCGWVKLEF